MTLNGLETCRPAMILAMEIMNPVLTLALKFSAGSPSPAQEEATGLGDKGGISSPLGTSSPLVGWAHPNLPKLDCTWRHEQVASRATLVPTNSPRAPRPTQCC